MSEPLLAPTGCARLNAGRESADIPKVSCPPTYAAGAGREFVAASRRRS